MIPYMDVTARLILSLVFGGLIGLEREVVHKPAGIRTHMLVCVGSALFVLVAIESTPSETARILAGIATGIGFLGAGTIFKSKSEVHGLTTAASIWAVAAVGLAIGMGYYLIGVISTIIVLLILQLNKLRFFKEL